jgi:hypothetical protein
MTTRRDKFRKAASEARASTGVDAINVKFYAEPVTNEKYPELSKQAGSYWVGRDSESRDVSGMTFIADVGDTMRGFRKFVGEGKAKAIPVYAIVTIGGDVLPPKREDLGDNDQGKWPASKFREGEPQDPWRVIWILPAYDERTGDTVVLAFETVGGIASIGDLVDAYAERPEGDEKLPLISLQSHSRLGSNGRRYFFPILRIEGWVDRPADARRLTPPPLPIEPVMNQGELFGARANGKGTPLVDESIPF